MSDNLRRYRAIRNALTQAYPTAPTGNFAPYFTGSQNEVLITKKLLPGAVSELNMSAAVTRVPSTSDSDRLCCQTR